MTPRKKTGIDIGVALNTMVDQGFDVVEDATALVRQIDRLPYDNLGFDEPLRLSANLLSIAGAYALLARTIMSKCTIERDLRQRLERKPRG